MTVCILDAAFTTANFAASQRFADGVIETEYAVLEEGGSGGLGLKFSTRSFMHPKNKTMVTELAFSGASPSLCF